MKKTIAFIAAAVIAVALFPTHATALPEGAKSHKNLTYVEGGHERQKLDLHVPAKPTGPLLVFIHGGAWRGGSKDHVDLGLLNAGYSIASINYRLSQHAPFPAQIEDCKSAIRWLRANAADYGYDPERIAVAGMSAGGHLAALVATTGDTRQFDKGEHLDRSSAVSCGIDFFGPTDFPGWIPVNNDPMIQRSGPDSCVTMLFKGGIEEKGSLARDASPVTWVSVGDAPLFILHGTKDHLVGVVQSQTLADRYKAVGIEVELDIIEGAGHGGPPFGEEERVLKMFAFLEKNLAVKP